MAKSEWIDRGGSIGSAAPEFEDVQDAGEPWPRAFIADLIQHRGPLCPKCGIGFDTDGDGDCAICAGKPDSNHPLQPPYGHPISKEELLEYRKRLFAKLDGVLLAKGNDYNSAQQNAGDTLFNLRICAILGIVPTPEDGVLVRLADKLMRVVSLTRPSAVQKVKDESIEDTIGDAINYLSYLSAMIIKSRRGTL